MTEQPNTELAAVERTAIERKRVWVFIEHADGRIADVSLELVGKARDLAGQAGYDVVGLLCGHDVDELAQDVIRHGADRVLLADHPELADYRTPVSYTHLTLPT